MRPLGLRDSLKCALRALLFTTPILALLDWLGTSLVLPLTTSTLPLAGTLALDVLRYWAWAALFTFPLVAVGITLAARAPWFAPAPLLGLGFTLLTSIGLARTLAGLPDRTRFEFDGLLDLYDWVTLGSSFILAIAIVLTLGPHLSRSAAQSTTRSRATLGTLAAVGAGLLPLVLAHTVAAPVYEHRIASALGLSALVGMATLLGSWVPLPHVSHSASILGLVLLFATGPWIMHPGARFVLHSHVPVAGSYATFFRAWTDFDGDGATATYLGGNDCAPFDPTVSPLHLEIPGDGIDQDCRGGDAQIPKRLSPAVLASECVPKEPQHIVLLTIDALRSDRVRLDRMPFLTSWARRSIWYPRAYPPSASTAGTLLGIFTGAPLSDLNPDALNGNRIIVGRTFVEELSSLGYKTAVFIPYDLHPALWRASDTISLPLDARSPRSKQSRMVRAQTSGILGHIAQTAAEGRHALAVAHVPDLHAPHDLSEPSNEGHPYDDIARSLDETLSEFITALRAAPFGRATTVILSADHGEQLGERGRVGHGTLFYEEGIRVPLLVSAPDCAPILHREPVSLLGLFPLVHRLAGLSSDETKTNPSAPVVVEEAELSSLGIKRAVIGLHSKLIVDLLNGGRVAFDLEADPEETVDVSDANSTELQALEESYQNWLDARRPLPK